MIESYQIFEGKLLAAESDRASVFVFTAPDASERSAITDQFGIDSHTVDSALDQDEISRFEQDGSDIHLIWRYPESVTTENGRFNFAVSAMGIFLVQQKLVVVRSRQRPLMENRTGMIIHGELDGLLHILNGTIHHYMKHLEVIKMIYREIQIKITEDTGNAHLIQMISLSESLVYYLNGIQANTVVVQRLKRALERAGAEDMVIEFLDDIQIDNSQCYQQAETYSQILSGLIDAQASLINNNMNSAIKGLTTINIVFLPLNLLASIGGMSEFSMMTKAIPWQISYALFCLGLTILGFTMAKYISHNRFSATTSVLKKSKPRWKFWRKK